MDEAPFLQDIQTSLDVQTLVDNAFANRPSTSIGIVVCNDKGSMSAYRPGREGFSCDTPVSVGCLAKPITATLLVHIARRFGFRMETDLSDLLADQLPDNLEEKLRGILVHHLLTHTHGLDDSAILCLPYTRDEFIDIVALCGQALAPRRLGQPGEIYSYGCLGAWLAAALIEVHEKRPYESVLHEFLESRGLEFPRESVSERDSQRYCPANGGALKLSLWALAEFCRLHSSGIDSEPLTADLGSMLSSPVDLPGWSPFAQRIHRGWKEFAPHWLGHNSHQAGAEICVRFSRLTQECIVIASSESGACSQALSLMTRDEQSRASATSHHSPNEPLDPVDSFTGTFRNARWQVEIDIGHQGKLRARIYDTLPQSNALVAKRYLSPIGNRVFISVPTDTFFPFFHFIQPTGSQVRLWNGWTVLGRATSLRAAV